ncbi:MAG: carbon storage regulator [Alphaproteobacteria bacterium]
MLHIKRKVGETIIINNNIEITILEVYENSVKIGCVSPRDTLILRKEQYNDISEENLSASSSNLDSFDIIIDLIEKNN